MILRYMFAHALTSLTFDYRVFEKFFEKCGAVA